MDEQRVDSQETAAGKAAQDLKSLRSAVARHLRDNKESLVAEIDRVLSSTMPEYDSLSADVISDMRQSFRDFVQLYMDYFEAAELPMKFIKSLATDVGKKRVRQGIRFNDAIGAFEEGETHVWDSITRELGTPDFTAEAWIELGKMRDRFTKQVRHYTRRAYLIEERSTVERQLEEFRALASLGQAILSTVDLEEVLGQILEVATSLMQAGMGAVLLLDQTGEFLEPLADMGLSRSWVARRRSPWRTVCRAWHCAGTST